MLAQIKYSGSFDLLYFVKLGFVKDFDSTNLPLCENFGLYCNHFAKFLLEPPILPFKSILKCTDSVFFLRVYVVTNLLFSLFPGYRL